MPRLIDLWEQIARRAMKIIPVEAGSIIGYAVRRYPNRSITGNDGFTVVKGEPLMELHLDSRLIEARTAGFSAHQRILYLRRELIAGLRGFAHLVKTDPTLAEIRGVWAFTLLNRGVEPLGFTVVDVPPNFTRWITTLYMKRLLSAYHPEHEGRLQQREEELVTKEIFMSRSMLLSRYGEERRKGRAQPQASSAE